MSTERSYVRTRGGNTVHRADCTILRSANIVATPWRWAEGKTPQEIEDQTRNVGITYHWCKKCLDEEAAS